MTGPLDVILNKVGQEIDKEMFYSQYGTCKDIDKDKRTCTFVPSGDEAERLNIRLQALMSSERGFVMIPVEGSSIAVTFVNKHTGFVALTEDIEEIIYQGGNNGGLVNVEPLIDKINNLESKLNEVIAWAKGVTPPLTSTPLLLTKRDELEDGKFKH